MSTAGRFRAAWRGGPLADRNFRLLTAGQFTSTVGDYCYAVATPLLRRRAAMAGAVGARRLGPARHRARLLRRAAHRGNPARRRARRQAGPARDHAHRRPGPLLPRRRTGRIRHEAHRFAGSARAGRGVARCRGRTLPAGLVRHHARPARTGPVTGRGTLSTRLPFSSARSSGPRSAAFSSPRRAQRRPSRSMRRRSRSRH